MHEVWKMQNDTGKMFGVGLANLLMLFNVPPLLFFCYSDFCCRWAFLFLTLLNGSVTTDWRNPGRRAHGYYHVVSFTAHCDQEKDGIHIIKQMFRFDRVWINHHSSDPLQNSIKLLAKQSFIFLDPEASALISLQGGPWLFGPSVWWSATHYELDAGVLLCEPQQLRGSVRADNWIYASWEASNQPVICHVSPPGRLIGWRGMRVESMRAHWYSDRSVWLLA